MKIPSRITEKNLLLIELNEVNLELAKNYVDKLGLKTFSQILGSSESETQLKKTTSEAEYANLEPWIQWPSVHTGKNATEHGVFRLGDMVGKSTPQFFEQVEAMGYSVGAISAMNVENRILKPKYFIPDPWTSTPTDGSWWSHRIGTAISQAVNDNAQSRLSFSSMVSLILGLVRFSQPKHYGLYLKLALGSPGKSWRKALFLDLFLHDLHFCWLRSYKPNFSTVFFNAGAHIQHHYFFNARYAVTTNLENPDWYVKAEDDPFAEMLQVYDKMLEDYLDSKDANVIIATGLTQVHYDRMKFYWRLRNHGEFLDLLGIKFLRVLPRMTRDFLIEFETEGDALTAEGVLRGILVRRVEGYLEGTPLQNGRSRETTSLFGEIDNRGKSLFVTLTWGENLPENMEVVHDNGILKLKPHVVFVAIKNGMHAEHGYAYYQGEIKKFAPPDGTHVKEIYNAVMEYFKSKNI